MVLVILWKIQDFYIGIQDTSISNRNLNAQKNTWQKHGNSQVELISYKGGSEKQFINSQLVLNSRYHESISLKTLLAFDCKR